MLRLAIVLNGFVQGYDLITATGSTGIAVYALGLGCVMIAVGLLIGFLTPLAALITACGSFIGGVLLPLESGSVLRLATTLPALDLAVMSLALTLLGPGAYSLDARLFARREIIIPDGRRHGL